MRRESGAAHGHGGKRAGAGRKRRYRDRVAHATRPEHDAKHPVHVTMRVVRGCPSLRTFVVARAIGHALHGLKERGRRVLHFTIQADHLHFIVEAADRKDLIRVARGTAIAIAKRVNGALRRHGRVFSDRYHTRAIATQRSFRATLVYVLTNHKKHGASGDEIDALSSGRWFDGWARRPTPPRTPSPVSSPQTALARSWRRFGLVDPRERPRSGWEEYGLTEADIHPAYRGAKQNPPGSVRLWRGS